MPRGGPPAQARRKLPSGERCCRISRRSPVHCLLGKNQSASGIYDACRRYVFRGSQRDVRIDFNESSGEIR